MTHWCHVLTTQQVARDRRGGRHFSCDSSTTLRRHQQEHMQGTWTCHSSSVIFQQV